jgi:hypothetical protein
MVRPIRVIGRSAVVAVTIGLGVLASACGGDSTASSAGRAVATTRPCPSAFALSLVSDRGAEATPIAAAVWFAKHGSVPVPVSGWHVVSRSSGVAVVAASASTLHVVEGTDQTWQVDSGHPCG